MTTIEYFKRQLESVQRNIVHAKIRGDTEAVKNLMEKKTHYKKAVKALAETTKGSVRLDVPKIRNRMHDLDMNQTDLGNCLGVCNAAVSRTFCAGICKLVTAQKYADALGVQIEDIVMGTDID